MSDGCREIVKIQDDRFNVIYSNNEEILSKLHSVTCITEDKVNGLVGTIPDTNTKCSEVEPEHTTWVEKVIQQQRYINETILRLSSIIERL